MAPALADLSGHPNIGHARRDAPVFEKSFGYWLRHKPLPITPQEAMHVLQRVGGAAAWAHRMGLCHGDIRPSHIHYPAPGATPMLCKWDLAGPPGTHAHGTKCTFFHDPAVIGQGGICVHTVQADVYSLGMTIHVVHDALSTWFPCWATTDQGKALKAVAQCCTRLDPFTRPSMHDVKEALRAMQWMPGVQQPPAAHAAVAAPGPAAFQPEPASPTSHKVLKLMIKAAASVLASAVLPAVLPLVL